MSLELTVEQKRLLADRLLEMADDELILGHRDSEWTGHAPIIEEDIAFANIAQDELGHAILWYEIRESLTGQTPDRMAFQRDATQFRNIQMVELPKGDWAFSIMRQFLFDEWEAVHLEELQRRPFAPMAQAAVKISQEEAYHSRHNHAWVTRLGRGTSESHRRMQAALDALWPYCAQLFVEAPETLAAADLLPDRSRLRGTWEERVNKVLEDAGLRPPDSAFPPIGRGEHTERLREILDEMQRVARLQEGVSW